jgi:hypothetical protein
MCCEKRKTRRKEEEQKDEVDRKGKGSGASFQRSVLDYYIIIDAKQGETECAPRTLGK